MFKLCFIHLKVAWFQGIEAVRVLVRYYRRPLFLYRDLLLGMHYLFKSPYRIHKHFLKKRGEKAVYTYGETPLTTIDQIARHCRLLSRETLYDLGCGTGRTSLWLATFVRCQVVGIDHLPSFIEKAQQVARLSRASNLTFIQQDILEMDFHKATALYLSGTTFSDEMIHQLMARFSTLKPGTKVITVSYPLSDYSSAFYTEKEFTGRFPWGRTSIFLNIKTED